MRKLLIFAQRAVMDTDSLENFLYDTEASRDAFLEMIPQNQQTGKLSECYYHYSEWDLMVPEGDKYEYLHVAFEGDAEFVAVNPPYQRLLGFEKLFRGTKGLLTVVSNRKRKNYRIYRLHKEMSDKVTTALSVLLEQVDNETFSGELVEFGLSTTYRTADDESEGSGPGPESGG